MGAFILYNLQEMEGMYTLNLESASQTFQYNYRGNSPASQQKVEPLELKSLTFALLDN